ncbi:unnamed protein product [Callosobruchus maculatus]|uniref:Uncharacterized protein n=1 Tax=Callosobruchus maculatus TaxID=64391 RepID=A0A653CL24_CALMS|nr:unnamed protein product [Callosobruchus maculatus]
MENNILKDVSHSDDHQDDNHNNYLCHYHKHRLPQILAWAAEIRSIDPGNHSSRLSELLCRQVPQIHPDS